MRFSLEASSASTTVPGGTIITIYGGPNATANIPGSHNDPADLYGIILVLVVIFVSIALVRWLFGRRGAAGSRRSR